MEEVSSYLDMQITAPAMGMKQVVSEEQMTRMLDLLYADLEFLQEKNISVRVRWNENTLWLLPKSNNENEAVRFTDLTENKMLGAWREKVFIIIPEIWRKHGMMHMTHQMASHRKKMGEWRKLPDVLLCLA